MDSPAKKESKGGKGLEQFVSLILLLSFWIIITLPSQILTHNGINNLIQHVAVGIPLAYLVVRIVKLPILTESEIRAHRLPNILRLIHYIFYLISQIILGGVDVARRVMRPTPLISPGLVKFHTPLKDDLQIVINANSITLTPGTITVDVVKDDKGSTFWVHSISQEGLASVQANKGFVDKILNIYRK